MRFVHRADARIGDDEVGGRARLRVRDERREEGGVIKRPIEPDAEELGYSAAGWVGEAVAEWGSYIDAIFSATILDRGYDVNVFAYEGAVALSFARQAGHAYRVVHIVELLDEALS